MRQQTKLTSSAVITCIMLVFITVAFWSSASAEISVQPEAATSTPVAATSTGRTMALAPNDRAFALDRLSVYQSSNFDAPIGAQAAGSQGFVIDGPATDAEGFAWWKIDYDGGMSGWVVGRYVSKIDPPAGYSLEGEVRVTDSTAQPSHPKADGDRVVWSDNRSGPSYIYVFNLRTNKTRRLTSGSDAESNPSISGDRVAYVNRASDANNPGHDGNKIYVHDFSSGKTQPLNDDSAFQSQPVIRGDAVAYVEPSGAERTITLYDLLTGAKESIASGSYVTDLAFDGNYVAWADSADGKWKVYVYDLKNKFKRTITSHFGDQLGPALSGSGKLVVADRRPPEFGDKEWNVYLYDLVNNTEKRVTKASGGKPTGLSASGDLVAYSRDGSVYSYDLKTDAETKQVDISGDQKQADLNGSTLVWLDGRNGGDDVYVGQVK